MTRHAAPAERREQILAAALRCFAAKGLHAATMDDVARAAGLSKGAVYHHFRGKREIFLALADAYEQLVDHLMQAWEQDPGMHVYHYAPYEVTALKRLVVAHQTGEDYLDDLLRAGVFVDLYAVIRRSVRVGQPSYSIKKLEPLYMGDQLRTGEVTNAADSIAEYAEYCAASWSPSFLNAATSRSFHHVRRMPRASDFEPWSSKP